MTAVDYEIRRSARARRVRVNVDPVSGRVEVVLPQRAPERAAEEAVSELRSWITKQLDRASATRAQVAARGDSVPFLGRSLSLVPEPGRTRVHRRGDELIVPSGDARPALERWYRRQARAEIGPRLDVAVEQLGVEYKSLRIGSPRTRWGSCSASGAMSFNWRLLLAPEAVLGYVVWHEACHLRVLDHSPNFWRLLEEHVPDYKQPSRWLQRNGATLVL